MNFERLIGPQGKLPILIRDDDTNYFTKETMLDSIYSEAWKKAFKVCFSIVPCQAGINDVSVPPHSRNRPNSYSIEDNKQLVDYLNDKIHNGTIEVLQHGFSHRKIDGHRGEYGKNFHEHDTKLGRNIMRSAFGSDPTFFVPPGEDISEQNLSALSKLGYIPIYRKTVFDKFMRNSYVPSFLKDMAAMIIAMKYNNETEYGKRPIQFIKPVILSVENKTISWSLSSLRNVKVTSFESLLGLTEKVIKSGSLNRRPICIINHYHIYFDDWNSSVTRSDLFQVWKRMLDSFDKLTFSWKVTFFELYTRTNQIRNIQIAKTGSKITIESPIHIHDFSFRTTAALKPNSRVSVDEMTNINTIQEMLPQEKLILYEKN